MSAASVASAQAAPIAQPASETVTADSQLRGGFIIPLIALIAILLGILAAVGGDNDRPVSP